MFRSACDFLAGKAGLDVGADNASDEDSSKENSIINGQTPSPTKGTPVSAGAPWGHTLTPKTGGQVQQAQGKPSQQRLVLNNSTTSASPPKQNVPWSDLSFAAEVVSPGFASRVVREAHNHNTRSPVESRRQYPTAQERYVRAGVLPNVRLGGRTKAVLTPRRTPTSPLLPLGRSSSSTFSSSLSSDFLTSSTPRMPDIRSVASVLEPANSSNECVRDPTSVQAVVAALQQAQVGKGIKRGSCYMEPEDLSKRQKCSTTGSMGSTSMPINYSRDFLEEEQNCGSNSTGSGGGEKRALDLSPGAQGSPWQLSPENKKRCVPDPMIASFSSSKHILDLEVLQTSGRDTPYSMYDSRRDTDSESNPSVESGQTKNSDQSLHQQTSEATGGESCVISPGPSERDPSDRSGSHTPQSTRGESCNSSGGGGQGGTTNTSRTSTPRNPTPPRPTHVISLEAYKAEKVKSQQRLKKMLDMLFHIKESDEPRSSKSGESTPSGSSSAFSLATVTPAVGSSATSLTLSSAPGAIPETLKTTASSVPAPATGGFGSLITPNSLFMSKTTEEDDMPSPSDDQTTSDGSKNEISASFTFSLKSANTSVTSKDSESGSKGEELTKEPNDGDNDVSVTAVLKLPASSSSDAAVKVSAEDATTLSGPGQEKSSDAPTSPLVDFLKSSTSVKDGTTSNMPLNRNPLLCGKTPTQVTSTSAEPNQIPGISPLTFTTSAPVNQGNTGIFTVGQTSSPASQVTSVATPSAFSVALPQAVTSVSDFFTHSVPQTASSAVTLSTGENAQSSSLTSLSFGSNNNDKSAGFQQSNNDGTSGSSNSVPGNGVSGFFNNTSNAAKLTVTSQGGLDVPATSAEEPSIAPTADPTAVDSGVSLGNASSTANSLAANQGDIDTETSAPNVGSATQSSANPSSVMSSGFFSCTPSIAKTSAISQGGLDASMTTSPVGSFSALSSNSSTVMSSGFFSSTSSTAKSSATSQGGLDSPMTTSTEGLPTAPATNPSAGLFTFGSGNNMLTPQQSSFTFLDPKKTTSSADSTTGSAAPVLGFSFGTSQASNSTTLPFGSTGVTQTSIPSTSSGFSSGLTFGSQTGSVASSVTAPSPFGASTASVTAPPGNATTAVAATTQASPFSFGQSTTALPTTTASASPFTFGSSSTHGGSGTSSVFQFGGATASATTGTGTPPQPFAPAVVSTQSSTTASSLFTFVTPGTTTATSVATTTTPSAVTPSLFTFGLPKTNTTAPTFGTTTNASVKAAPSSGFGFGSTPAAASTTSAPSAGFTFGSSVTTPASGFQFGAANKSSSTDTKSSSPFTFGNTENKTPNFGAASSSPFSFGGNTSTAPAFGSNPSQGFGALTTSAPTFGVSTPSFGTATANPTSPFGSANTFVATSPNSSFSFGAAASSNKTNSGANLFGVQGTTPSFGAANNPAPPPDNLVLTGTGGFSSTQNPAFGTPTFGSDNAAASKGAAFQFGQGTSNPPSFGAAAASATFRGATNPPTFGGATNPPTFGGAASATGAPGGPVFQFGSTGPPSFNTGNNPSSNAPRRPRARVRGRNR